MGQKSNFYVEIRSLHSEVTGSCFVCKISFNNGVKKFFLVDVGLFQEKEYLDWNEKLTFNPEDIAFTLLTHNHVDHVGRLPLLYRRGCKSRVYASIGTAMALPINLEDTLKVMQERYKKTKKNVTKFDRNDTDNKNNIFPPIYYKEDVKQVYNHLKGIPYNIWIKDKKIPSVSFKFLPNAHLPGASMIWVKIKEPEIGQTVNLLFLGDWNTANVFQGRFKFPEELRYVPFQIICESTYGSTRKAEIKESFQQNIQEAVENNKTVLLPVISQYRAQEMLWYMKKMKEEGKIPFDTPIYFSGPLGLKYIYLYQNDKFPDFIPERKNFLPSALRLLSSKGSLKYVSIGFGIYIITGGMGSNGPSSAYLKVLLPNPDALIQFSSYCAEDTLGRKLQETENGEEVQIGGTPVKKLADVRFTSELSGHAKADELLEFLSEFKKIKALLITHGAISQREAFRKLAEKANVAKEVVIIDRNNYVRLNPWGILDKKIWKD